MRIGEALAEARHQADLTIAEVSQRTRIREEIIREIEDDDYSACGGDFYARGNIRSIARAVGVNPEPLIREYDAVHRSPGVLSAVSLDELQTPVHPPEPHRRTWAAVLALALVVALGFAGYTLLAGSPPGASTHPAANPVTTKAGRSRTPPAPKASPTRTRNVHTVVVHLTAISRCWVVFSTPRGRLLLRSLLAAGASDTWTFRHAVDLRLANPNGITLTVDGVNPLPPGPPTRPVTLLLRPGHPAAIAPSPRPRVPPRTLNGPAATVHAYIAAINDHDYARAWSIGGQNTGWSYSSFISGFSTTARDTLTILSVSGDVVTARLTAQQTDGTVKTYQGTYTVQNGVIIGFDVLQVG